MDKSMRYLLALLLLSTTAYAADPALPQKPWLTPNVSTFGGDVDISDYMSSVHFNLPHIKAGFQDSSRTLTMTTNEWVKITNASGNLFAVRDSARVGWASDTIISRGSTHKALFATIGFNGNNGEVYQVKWTTTTGTMFCDVKNLQTTAANDVG